MRAMLEAISSRAGQSSRPLPREGGRGDGGALLAVTNLEVRYGGIVAVKGVSFAVEPGEMACLIGANGAGKTTTLKALARLLPARGEIRYRGARIDTLPGHALVSRGLALVPEGRGVFSRLTVAENLAMGAYHRPRHERGEVCADLDRIHELLPRLKERRHQLAGTLSGGEQQMLAIGRALMTNPVFMIFDEATEGLAPLIREEIWTVLETNLREAGQAILVIDKHPEAMARIADRHYVMEKGRIVWSGNSAALLADQAMQERLLGV